MIGFPDTSFLCAFYQSQDNSHRAAKYFAAMTESLHVASPLLFEFRQSTRLQVFLYERDASKGFSRNLANLALAKLQANIADGHLVVVPIVWADVLTISERISAQYTFEQGFRAFDILHLATALHLGAREFLTFDLKQKKLAEAEGLTVPF